MQKLITLLQCKYEADATLFPNTECVVQDQFLLGMENPLICPTLSERRKLEPGLTMNQVLKEAIPLEKEKQVETPPVTVLAAMAPVRVDGMDRRITSLEEVVRDLRETLTLGMGRIAYQAQESHRYPSLRGLVPKGDNSS